MRVTEEGNTPVNEGGQGEDAHKERMESAAAKWAERVRETASNGQTKEAFDRMQACIDFARGLQWPDQKKLDDKRYVTNITQRHLRQRESALYAKNPKAEAKRRQTLDFAVWDEDPASLEQAQQTLQAVQMAYREAAASGAEIPPAQLEQMASAQQEAQQILEDYQNGMRRRRQLGKMGQTLEIVWEHQIGEQQPPFKTSMKQLVRRSLTVPVGYLKLGYHRFGEMQPEDQDRITDATERVRDLEVRLEKLQKDGEAVDDTSAELYEAEQALQAIQEDATLIQREGLDVSFPRSHSIIVDPACIDIQTFLGADWVAQQFILTPDAINKIYGVDVGDEYTAYNEKGDSLGKETLEKLYEDGRAKTESHCKVYEVYQKSTLQTFTVCEGYPGYLESPASPRVQLERFWPVFTLVFNGVEDPERLYPPSDVELIWDAQVEKNISRQRLREHRDAARPGHVAPRGRLEPDDKSALENREAHSVVELDGLQESDDVRRILQPIPTNPIDPNLYETGTYMEDVYQTLGSQEAVLGGTSGASATETSIAESSRLSTIGSAVDELDDFLTEVAKAGSHILLQEMSAERVREIAGPGAVWPEATAGEIMQDLWLEVRAGSSGRPNKSAEIQNMERIMPFLLQIPGAKPKRLLQELISRMDDRLDVNEFYDAALPAITAQNRADQVATGDPGTDPAQQGGEGGDQTAVERGDSNMGPRAPEEPRVMDPNRR